MIVDAGRVEAALAQIASADEQVEGFFERAETQELRIGGFGPPTRLLREEGFALRILRGERQWSVAHDGAGRDALAQACRQVARSTSQVPRARADLAFEAWDEEPRPSVLAEFARRIESHLRERRVAFALELVVRRHRRWVEILGQRLAAEPQREEFFSVEASVAGAPWGTLLPALDGSARRVAFALAESFRARSAAAPPAADLAVLLGPSAAAVFLHEAVAHTLEADSLALTGRPGAAIGLAFGSPQLDLLDDPAAAPHPVRRTVDDEGHPVSRRWLLRGGVIEQPLADRAWSALDRDLLPGAARRAHRQARPGPRTQHLELLPGERATEALLAEMESGLFVEEVERGALDPVGGGFRLRARGGHRIAAGRLDDRCGALELSGTVAAAVQRVDAVASESRAGGAGWCAKDGHRLPVWATTPALRIDGLRVDPA